MSSKIQTSFLKNTLDVLPGIGHKKKALFTNLSIENIEDLLFDFPKSYEDRQKFSKIRDLKQGDTGFFLGQVTKKVAGRTKKRWKASLTLWVEDESSRIQVIFLNGHYLTRAFNIDESYYFYGKIKEEGGVKKMFHPEFYKKEASIDQGLVPVYGLTKGLTQKERRKAIKSTLESTELIEEYLPQWILSEENLLSIQDALKQIHYPKNHEMIVAAQKRLIYEELFFLQLGISLIKNKYTHYKQGISFNSEISVYDFIKGLPFSLTGCQLKAIEEIIDDMEKNSSMNRLIQGDVGSGKTVVAAAASYKAVMSGYQVALMAPTELLAQQHYTTFKAFFTQHDIKIGLLTGKMKSKEKEKIRLELETGAIQLVIGTHALIQDGVKFEKLGLVITDEQHRFGVYQRMNLAEKGQGLDVLVMTATPIPRTLAFTLYGDLDVSSIKEKPPGRKEIETISIHKNKRKEAYQLIKKSLESGKQAYVVCPLIEASEHIEAVSVETLYQELKAYFKPLNIGLLHGNMKENEKNEIMTKFSNNHINLLVSTSVIEVGIDVPNATIMMVEDAQRFGLAQLHQLRGRVGRGLEKSYCILVNNGNSEMANQRIKIMKNSNDGFIIAEKDMELRGPGELFGTKQHGLPELKIASVIRDFEMMKRGEQAVKKIIKEDETLSDRENKKLKKKVEDLFFGKNQINI